MRRQQMIYRFGSARLDTESRELMRDGVERPLTPKAFDLLRILIEFRPRVLSKNEIMDLIWPDAFVAEANVGILIGDIRAAIGDGVDTRLIKTHHGIGYSFCGEVLEQTRNAAVAPGGTVFVLAVGERRITLGQGTLIVGRDAQCGVVIADASVSRRHARLEVTSTTVDIEDLQSKNGTRVNGNAIVGKTRLVNGSVVTFGSLLATFHGKESASPSTLTL